MTIKIQTDVSLILHPRSHFLLIYQVVHSAFYETESPEIRFIYPCGLHFRLKVKLIYNFRENEAIEKKCEPENFFQLSFTANEYLMYEKTIQNNSILFEQNRECIISYEISIKSVYWPHLTHRGIMQNGQCAKLFINQKQGP